MWFYSVNLLPCHTTLKPLNVFSKAFQTHASRIGTLQADVRRLFSSFIANFVDPDVIRSTEDIITIDYSDSSNQLSNDELGIGTSTRLLLCGDLEDWWVLQLRGVFLETYAYSMKQVHQK